MIHGCLIKREKKVKVTYFHSRNSWGMRGNFKNLPQVCLMYCILLTTLHKITILELSSEVVGLFQRNIWIVMLSMVFCDQNCSDLLWEKTVLVIEKNIWNSRLKGKNCKIFEITRTIYSNSERSEQFLVTECFLTCSWRFLRSQKIEQL